MGRWKELNIPWYETSTVSCVLCGQFIPRRVWVAQAAGKPRSFCSRRCEQIYRQYWLPRHGGTDAASVFGGDAGGSTGIAGSSTGSAVGSASADGRSEAETGQAGG